MNKAHLGLLFVCSHFLCLYDEPEPAERGIKGGEKYENNAHALYFILFST